MSAMPRSLKGAPGCQADDSSGTLREQMRHHCSRAEKSADQVSANDPIPLLLCHLFDRACGKNASVVDENIHVAVFVERVVDHPPHRFLIGYIRIKCRCFAADTFDLSLDSTRICLIEIRDHQRRSLASHP